MADYTAIVEAGNAIVELLRDNLTPEPLGNRELIALCSPHESENNQLTLYLYHIEEENQNMTSGFYQVDQNTQRRAPAQFILRYLVTAHSKAPVQLRQADQHRIIGAAIQTLRDNPVVPQRYLSGSLDEEHAQIHLAIEKVPLEQLLKIWNNTSKEYKMSFVLMVTGVTIASRRKRQITRITDFEVSVNPDTHESLLQRRVSAVLRLRDGFLGTPIETGGAVFRIDGTPVQPQSKPGGYRVWTDLPAGRHTLSISQHGFQTEEIALEVGPDKAWEGCADLKPGVGYPFGRDAATVRLTVQRGGQPLANEQVWLAVADNAPLKLAQDQAEAGAQTLRLFCKGEASSLPLPGAFLLEEDDAPELVTLRSFAEETGTLAAPLAHTHARGRALLPAQAYRTDEQGRLRIMLREAVRLAVLCDGSIRYAEPAADGENEFTLRFD